jgi:thiamine-monophosphate kinase
MSENENRTSIDSIGKYGLIDRLTGNIKIKNSSTILAAGDDSAAIRYGEKGPLSLISTDLLMEGIHFNLVYTPLKHLGYKSVIRAISDIYAMNGNPAQIFVSIGIGSRFSVENIEELYSGINLACKKYCIDLSGGDTTSSLTGLTICVTAVGSVEEEKLVKRSGAGANDLICVTGDLGAAYMGLQLLERERKLFDENSKVQPDLSGYEYIIERQLKPEFPSDIIVSLGENEILPSAMTDISEGLASDLLQICRQSDKGCRLFPDKIPVDTETARMAEEFRIDPLVPALNGGEDFELLFTVPLESFENIKKLRSVKVIGHITQPDYGCFIVTDEGEEIELEAQGWKR